MQCVWGCVRFMLHQVLFRPIGCWASIEEAQVTQSLRQSESQLCYSLLCSTLLCGFPPSQRPLAWATAGRGPRLHCRERETTLIFPPPLFLSLCWSLLSVSALAAPCLLECYQSWRRVFVFPVQLKQDLHILFQGLYRHALIIKCSALLYGLTCKNTVRNNVGLNPCYCNPYTNSIGIYACTIHVHSLCISLALLLALLHAHSRLGEL